MKRKYNEDPIAMLSQASVASAASIAVDNRASSLDEDTTIYFNSYCKPNKKNFGAKVGRSRAGS